MSDASPSPSPVTTVAAFDVDGTLTRKDCVIPFLARIRGRWPLAMALLRHPVQLSKIGFTRDRDAAKELAIGAALTGASWSWLQGEANDFADTVVRTGMRADALARLRWHRAEGHRIVLVSASLEVYLVEMARRIGADAVLGTRLAVGADGRCTGALDGPNCRGPEKEVRLRRWLAAEGLTGATLWAYGDSAGDDELLAMADHPHRVHGVTLTAAPDEAASKQVTP